MRNFKKILAVVLVIVMGISLVGCKLSEEQEKTKQEYETTAKPIIEEFCKKQFKNQKYTINSIEGYHYTYTGGVFSSECLSSLVQANITLQGKTFNLYYDIDTEEFFTDINNESIEKELKQQIYNIIPLDCLSFKCDFYPYDYYECELNIVNVTEQNYNSILANKDYTLHIDIVYDNEDSNYFSTIETALTEFCTANIQGEYYIDIVNKSKYASKNTYNKYDNDYARNDMIYISNHTDYTYIHYSHYDIDDLIITTEGNVKLKINKTNNTVSNPNAKYYLSYEFTKANKKAIMVEPYNSDKDINIDIYINSKFSDDNLFVSVNALDDNENLCLAQYTQRKNLSLDLLNEPFIISYWKGEKNEK